MGFPGGTKVKNLVSSTVDVRDAGLIPVLGRSPWEGHGSPLQYSCLENPMDRRAWWATVHRVRRDWSNFSTAQHRKGIGSFCLLGTVSVWDDEKVLEMNSDDSYKIIINVLNATEPFKMVKVVNFMLCILFIYLAAMGLACDMRDLIWVMRYLSSQITDRTCIPCNARQILNHQTTREIPVTCVLTHT